MIIKYLATISEVHSEKKDKIGVLCLKTRACTG